jgi:ResB-like family protein
MKINLASTKLAFVLISILVVLIILSAIIPQRDISTGQIFDLHEELGSSYKIIEALHLDRIYKAPYFFILLGFLVVNIAFGNFKRFRLIYRTEKTLLKIKYIGSIVFHLSIVLILVSTILNYLFYFEKVFALTEGQIAFDNEPEYHRIFRGPLQSDSKSMFQLGLDSLELNYQIKDELTKAAYITVNWQSDDKITKGPIWKGKSIEDKNYGFHFGKLTGYSPELIIADTAGETIFRSFVRTSTRKEGDIEKYSDFLEIPNTDFTVAIEVMKSESEYEQFKFNLNVEKKTTQVYNGFIKLDEEVKVDDFILKIPRLRKWCYIHVIKNPYLGIIFIGFWSALSGLLITFVSRLKR